MEDGEGESKVFVEIIEGRCSEYIIYLNETHCYGQDLFFLLPGLGWTCRYWSCPFHHGAFPPCAPVHSVLKDEQSVCRILYESNLWLWILFSFSGEGS